MGVIISGNVSFSSVSSVASGTLYGDFVGLHTAVEIGTDQYVFTEAKTFTRIAMHSFENAASNVTVNVRINDVVVATATLLAGNKSSLETVSFSVNINDYMTLDLATGSISNLSVRLDF